MGIYYKKRMFCGCELIAVSISSNEKLITKLGHICYKWICDKCIKLPEETLDNRLKNIAESNPYVYNDNIDIISGWTRICPTSYEGIVREFCP